MTAQTTVRSKRGPYSSPRQQERQRRILETARREITLAGYDSLTMQQLASASGVSTKTLYNLYGSKDELLLAAVAELLGNLEQNAVVSEAQPGVPALLAFTGVVCQQIIDTPRYAEVMARALFQADSQHRLVDILLGNSVRFYQSQLQVAVDLRQVDRDLDVSGFARRLAAHQWGIILLWSKGLFNLEELAHQALDSQKAAVAAISL